MTIIERGQKESRKKYLKGYREKNKEKIAANQREYWKKNKALLCTKKKEYYQKNKDDIKRKNNEYRKKHRDERVEYCREYYYENRDSLLEDKKVYYEENIERIKEMRRRPEIKEYKRFNYIKTKYGLTKEAYFKMIELQDNKCLICKRELGPKIKPVVDHDHKTGKVRNIICDRCNVMLGRAVDDQIILYNAIIYLNKHDNSGLFADGAGV